MCTAVHKNVNDRPVIDRTEERDISQAPEMKKLVELHNEMIDEEKTRTVKYLKDQDGGRKSISRED